MSRHRRCHRDHLRHRLRYVFILARWLWEPPLISSSLISCLLHFYCFCHSLCFAATLCACTPPRHSCLTPVFVFATLSSFLLSSLARALSQPNLLRQMVAHPETGSALRLPPILKGSFSATNEAERVHTAVCANCQKASQSEKKKKRKKFCPFPTRHSVD